SVGSDAIRRHAPLVSGKSRTSNDGQAAIITLLKCKLPACRRLVHYYLRRFKNVAFVIGFCQVVKR
ncbi:hypothetical protein, partial [Rhizobium leguminosarum]|uniref:hypothetical protein n=1 Tax=Rhizobium leguminosarum TaxID=384 RepID=UPI001954B870